MSERLVEKNGEVIDLGSRAHDILTVLLKHAGDVVSTRDLLAQVWSGVNVDEGSVRFHIAKLRKTLGDGQDGARYITNVPARGYCFVAPITRELAERPASTPFSPPEARRDNLPLPLNRMVGRDEAVLAVAERLETKRFITVVGPGGIGKTTLAVAIGHHLRAKFNGAIHFIDLAQLNDPLLVPIALASTFGLSIQTQDVLPDLVNFLRGHRSLVILDSSEHLIDAVAALTEHLFPAAQELYILATSREPLQVEGEHVYHLSPFDSPADDASPSAAQAMAFPAVQLFVERVAASQGDYRLSDADAPTVANICRKLDGIALAIELAASRVGAYGLEGMAALLDDSIKLHWRGRRTALARHRTLGAVLDWSYNLLSEIECLVLRRISIFVGAFTFEAAQFIAGADDTPLETIVDSISNLVAKSLIAVMRVGNAIRYRLLDTTRAYAALKLADSGEANAIAARHAAYYRRVLSNANAASETVQNSHWVGMVAENLGNTRAALEWSFSCAGDLQIGKALALASAPLFQGMSLLTECHRWTERALEVLDESERGTKRELELTASLGQSLMFTKASQNALDALERGLTLAEKLDDTYQKIRLLDGLRVFHLRGGNFGQALELALRGEAVVQQSPEEAAETASLWMLTNAQHLLGAQDAARNYCDAALARMPRSSRLQLVNFGYDLRIAALCNRARILWLQGDVSEALAAARQGIREAQLLGHSFTLCIALIWSVPVFIWSGDRGSAEENIEILICHARKYSLGPYNPVSLGFKGELALKNGETKAGVQLLRSALEILGPQRYQNVSACWATSLAEGLVTEGKYQEALALVDGALAEEEARGNSFYTAETARIKAIILAAMPGPDRAETERWFRRSLDLAHRQSALGWELRAATSYAVFLAGQGDGEAARMLLSTTCAKFRPDADYVDLRNARKILEKILYQQPDNAGSATIQRA